MGSLQIWRPRLGSRPSRGEAKGKAIARRLTLESSDLRGRIQSYRFSHVCPLAFPMSSGATPLLACGGRDHAASHVHPRRRRIRAEVPPSDEDLERTSIERDHRTS